MSIRALLRVATFIQSTGPPSQRKGLRRDLLVAETAALRGQEERGRLAQHAHPRRSGAESHDLKNHGERVSDQNTFENKQKIENSNYMYIP